MSVFTVYNYFMEENLQPVQSAPQPVNPVPTPTPVPSVQPPIIEQASKPNKTRVFILVLVLVLILAGLVGLVAYYTLGMKTSPSLSAMTPVPTVAQIAPTATPSSQTVSNSTGNSDTQLNKDSQTVDNNLNGVSQDLNSFDQAVNQKLPSDLSQ